MSIASVATASSKGEQSVVSEIGRKSNVVESIDKRVRFLELQFVSGEPARAESAL